MSTGIVTTTRVTHATPACSYAHSANRGWESDANINKSVGDDGSKCKDIALQLVEYPYGDGIEVVFAGGRRKLMHKNQTDPEYPDKKGERLDGRDLIKEWVNKHQNSKYVWNKTEFEKINVEEVDHVLGTKHFMRNKGGEGRGGSPAPPRDPPLPLTLRLNSLPPSPRLRWLSLLWDLASHPGRLNIERTISLLTAPEIIKKSYETLITVTADHSHVFTIGGYPKRGNPVFGIIQEVDNTLTVDTENRTYTTLGYADGPGGLNGSRQDLRNIDTADKDFLQQATVLLAESESHGSEDVGVFADGPGAYLFHGVVEQQYVFHVMDYALCLSESKQKSCEKHVNRGGKPNSKSGSLSLSVPSLYSLLLISISYAVLRALEA
ncbi:unnamed protein product [Porites evermanni]|uniref:alkaline phosphatase n=1 Tax=Porites evermanni TaxID=104178 RepID=A0ABN8M6J8_9CNID|nr:unnamed protein product [Porites evermanni]